ncbi:MAG: hypothetical protein O3A55_00850 [Bacteroidetes bacterium]|nr:hypothetical protein [Bacteroidota bacterium]
MIHQKIPTNPLSVGKKYKFSLNGNHLYNGEVLITEGCWATIKVINIAESIFKNNYHEGQTFEIKTSNYFFEAVGDESKSPTL